MSIEVGPAPDPQAFADLTIESQDHHRDAMRAAVAALPELTQLRAEREPGVDTDEIERSNLARRAVLGRLARTAAGIGLGGLWAGLLATPARADVALDVQILQTASSLEALAVFTYGLALGDGPDRMNAPPAVAMAALPPGRATDTLTTFVRETQHQHAEHKKAFQMQTTALGGRVQDAPNPKFLALVTSADLSSPAKLIDFAATLEKVATDTYLLNLSLLQDTRTKAMMVSVMAVEAQHLAILRLVGALLSGGAGVTPAPQLIAIPFPVTDLARLPASAGSSAFQDAFHAVNGPDQLADPASGAVR